MKETKSDLLEQTVEQLRRTQLDLLTMLRIMLDKVNDLDKAITKIEGKDGDE